MKKAGECYVASAAVSKDCRDFAERNREYFCTRPVGVY